MKNKSIEKVFLEFIEQNPDGKIMFESGMKEALSIALGELAEDFYREKYKDIR